MSNHVTVVIESLLESKEYRLHCAIFMGRYLIGCCPGLCYKAPLRRLRSYFASVYILSSKVISLDTMSHSINVGDMPSERVCACYLPHLPYGIPLRSLPDKAVSLRYARFVAGGDDDRLLPQTLLANWQFTSDILEQRCCICLQRFQSYYLRCKSPLRHWLRIPGQRS